MKLTEKQIENDILKYLWLRPDICKVWKVETTGIFDPVKKVYRKKHTKFHLKGQPDIQGYLKLQRGPAPFYIEVKSETGRLSPDQKQFRDEALADGCHWLLARSLDDVIKYLSDLGLV